MIDTNQLPQMIRQERKRRGWSMEMLAGFAGVDYRTIWGYETGKHIPQLPTVLAILDALDYDVELRRRQ